jgi:polyisoprenoid-binding protein YceI
MKIRNIIAANLALLALCGMTAQAADAGTKLFAKPGSKIRVEGTSNIHDWQVEGTLIGGFLEVGSNFPLEPGKEVAAGKVDAKAEPFIMIRGLKSVEKDGKPYSDKMDEIMYEKLKADQFNRITYRLNELTLKEAAKSKDAPYVFEAKGDLVVAGVTNTITMPVNITPLGEGKLKISGTAPVKMSDFKIEPPAPKIALGLIKTGDDVKILFDWMVGPRTAPAAAK